MRILALSSWWPEPADNGIKLRMLHLLRALASEHEIHLAVLTYDPADVTRRAEIDRLCASATAMTAPPMRLRRGDAVASLWNTQPASVRARWSSAFDDRVRALASSLRPDIVLAFELSMAPYAALIPGVPRVLDDPELIGMASQPAHAPSLRRKLRSWLTWSKQRAYVRGSLRHFAGCSAVSEAELALVRSLAPVGLMSVLIPNGADIAGAAGDWGEPEPDTLIYPGSLTFSANLDSMCFFLQEIFPRVRLVRPNARLRITGRAGDEQIAALPSLDHVEMVGFVPNILAEVARAWCEVVPLRQGSGTRLKVLEALAVGTPVVATSKGIEGLRLMHEQHLLVADDPASFAAETVRLLEQAELRSRLAANGRRYVADHYDWNVIGQQMKDFIAEVGKNRLKTQHAVLYSKESQVL